MMTDEETYSKGIFSLTEWEDVNYCDHYFCVNDEGLTDKEVVDLLYELNKENEKLKQQLLYEGDDVCDICKHEYLTPSGNYFIGKCKKGHEECSKESLKYCTDFEVKELK